MSEAATIPADPSGLCAHILRSDRRAGSRILRASPDYFILRSLAHSRKLATEEQLDARYSQVSAESLEEEMPKFRKLIGRFEGHLPVDPGLRYLDMGCGTGELIIAFRQA
jgi:hypothetical protein